MTRRLVDLVAVGGAVAVGLYCLRGLGLRASAARSGGMRADLLASPQPLGKA
ncbi:hypothetical protein ORIO_04255 [Cereibacter azotoformans]|uniref:hypothetical protein n=1 Tax=Cereibacter azotoformans TaxID=43057 RepID=UPI001EEBF0AC|nr:hypothetical protein [Cereibacter azotoformans]ULB09140.1 hypothetical protein ORIO_04255 [Cereibacter azotoformans]